MDAPAKPSLGTRIMAFLCRICPLCVPARHWPDSRYAHRIRVIQNDCPFCAARIRVQRFRDAAVPTAPTLPMALVGK
jgi:hypothetical protein